MTVRHRPHYIGGVPGPRKTVAQSRYMGLDALLFEWGTLLMMLASLLHPGEGAYVPGNDLLVQHKRNQDASVWTIIGFMRVSKTKILAAVSLMSSSTFCGNVPKL